MAKRRGLTIGTAIAAAILAITVPFVAKWEGLRTRAYLDAVNIPTICYGETRDVALGDTATVAQCDQMLRDRLIEFSVQLDRCISNPGAVPPKVYAAVLSWTYNVGAGAACPSTLIRKLNTGDLLGACQELPRWNRAGGRVLQGLTNRRIDERALCYEGLPQRMGARP